MKTKNKILIFLLLLSSTITFSQTSKNNIFDVKVIGKGKPILFIPGATCSGDEWNETIEHYKNNYQCHVFTLAGYAGIPPLQDAPYLEKYKEGIKKYIITNKLEHVILVGHSIGGFLSIWLASEMKSNLDRIIVVDGLPFYAGMFDPNAKNGFDEQKTKSMLDYFNKMDSIQMKASQLNVAKMMCADSTKWNKIANWGVKSDKKTMAYTMNEMLGNDLRQKISSITIPVLVMDAYSPNPQFPQYTKDYSLSAYQQQYQNCKTCVVHVAENSKHFIMYDSPKWFYNEVDTFIGKK